MLLYVNSFKQIGISKNVSTQVGIISSFLSQKNKKQQITQRLCKGFKLNIQIIDVDVGYKNSLTEDQYIEAQYYTSLLKEKYNIETMLENQSYSTEGQDFKFVDIFMGFDGVSFVQLNHPNGSAVTISLRGLNITSWKNKKGYELLWQMLDSSLPELWPLRGGINFEFPQIPRDLNLQTGGFTKFINWDIVQTQVNDDENIHDPSPSVTLKLESKNHTKKVFNYDFCAFAKISLMETDDFPDPKWYLDDLHRSALESYQSFNDKKSQFAKQLDINDEQRPQRKRRQLNWNRKQAMLEQNEDKLDQTLSPQITKKTDESLKAEFGVPIQLKFEISITNTGDKDMPFECGILAYMRTFDQLGLRGENVKLRGYSGRIYISGEHHKGRKTLQAHPQMGDFHPYPFVGDYPFSNIDRIYPYVKDNKFQMCPGDRSHLEFQSRYGLKDAILQNHGKVTEPWSKEYVVMGGVDQVLPPKLKPGETYNIEYVIRQHDYYWIVPTTFQNAGPMPMPDVDEHLVVNTFLAGKHPKVLGSIEIADDSQKVPKLRTYKGTITEDFPFYDIEQK